MYSDISELIATKPGVREIEAQLADKLDVTYWICVLRLHQTNHTVLPDNLARAIRGYKREASTDSNRRITGMLSG